jgi:hypothetical protein
VAWPHNSLDQLDKFHDVQAPLAVLIFGDIGLRTIEPFRKKGLCESRPLARFDQDFEQVLMSGGMNGLGHAPAR